METSPAATAPAELIVHNGRKKGMRRLLKNAITIVGSIKGCDVRLDVPSVRPFHCVIAAGAEGPYLRAWGKDDTYVNDAAVGNGLLRDGDILRVGPFEFEVRVHVPEAEAVEVPLVAEAVPDEEIEPVLDIQSWAPLAEAADDGQRGEPDAVLDPALAQIVRLDALVAQARETRAQLRRERRDREEAAAAEEQNLTQWRRQLADHEDELTGERNRLRHLRSRFIKRWKRHWSSLRQRLENEQRQLENARQQLEIDTASLEQERTDLLSRQEVQGKRLEHAWAQVREAERQLKECRGRDQQVFQQREAALVRSEAKLQTERLTLQAQKMQWEHHTASLRIEADGMESRVVNLRAVLLSLEEKRAVLSQQQAETPAPRALDVASRGGSTDDRHADWQRLADELADQQTALKEQVDRLAAARETWRHEEGKLIAEMADLVERLRQREERLAEDEIAVALQREQVDRDAADLKQFGARLQARLARQESLESRWRTELGQRDFHLQLWHRRLQRFEAAIQELCRRWRERRRRELDGLRQTQARCSQLLQQAIDSEIAADKAKQATELQQIDLSARSLVIEKARQQLAETNRDPELARKKLERLGRHVAWAVARVESRLTSREESLARARPQLLDLQRRAEQLLEQAAHEQRDYGDRYAELERREYLATRQTQELADIQTEWSTERELLERERDDLRRELERLAALVIDAASNDSPPVLRAA